MSIQKRLSLNYGKHINQNVPGGNKLKVKGGISSETGSNLEIDSTDSTLPDVCPASASTSGVSSACSGSLQQLTMGSATLDNMDTNGGMNERGVEGGTKGNIGFNVVWAAFSL